ncbi:basic salivary proline-rich protein 1-like [Perognathus longimembris pacificus]|uniref:basic salivary proline-rich protein 1-like n=1 Tax=Perognathus longimembris pacificus TaxID=214514 RepID=UPI002018E02A|nr:basic salivary proline-rich protein 1-like [Perognathus longimembris pacificus]
MHKRGAAEGRAAGGAGGHRLLARAAPAAQPGDTARAGSESPEGSPSSGRGGRPSVGPQAQSGRGLEPGRHPGLGAPGPAPGEGPPPPQTGADPKAKSLGPGARERTQAPLDPGMPQDGQLELEEAGHARSCQAGQPEGSEKGGTTPLCRCVGPCTTEPQAQTAQDLVGDDKTRPVESPCPHRAEGQEQPPGPRGQQASSPAPGDSPQASTCPATAGKLQSPGSLAVQEQAPGQEPASRTALQTQGQEPASRTALQTQGREPASRTGPRTQGQEPASRTALQTQGQEPASRTGPQTQGQEPASRTGPQTQGQEPASRTGPQTQTQPEYRPPELESRTAPGAQCPPGGSPCPGHLRASARPVSEARGQPAQAPATEGLPGTPEAEKDSLGGEPHRKSLPHAKYRAQSFSNQRAFDLSFRPTILRATDTFAPPK